MADPNDPRSTHSSTNTTIRETRTERSGGSLAFIVGGLVVAVAVIAWLFFAGGDVDMDAAGGGEAGGTTVNVDAPEANAEADSGAEAAAPAEPADAGAGAEAGADAEATTTEQ